MDGFHVVVKDKTSEGTFDFAELFNGLWSCWYQGVFHYNRSPWVTLNLSAPLIDLRPIKKRARWPAGAYLIELLDATSEDALGWHEDKVKQSTAHSERGVVLHDETGEETPRAKVFVHTSKDAGVPWSEVLSHELLEGLVDPYVMADDKVRRVVAEDDKEWIVEVGDPVQDEGYDVGEPEGRAIHVPEAVVANFVLPAWFGYEPKGVGPFDFRNTRARPFELAPGGYQSVYDPTSGEWEQIWGADRKRAEANARAYEREGDHS